MERHILTCAKLCVESYEGGADFCTVDDLCYGVRNDGGVNYVVFRGTANTENALRDMWVRPGVTMTGYLAHKGFLSAFEQLQEVRNKIGALTILTGHSLGAAIALLFADAFDCRVVTFGCPRVFFRFGQAPDHIRHVRVICDDDPVPMVPRIFYRHLEDPVILRDRDHEWIDVADHSMKVYYERIRRRYEKRVPVASVTLGRVFNLGSP